MSAWAEIVNANGSDEWLELCSRALEEVQRETSRRNARRLRTEADTSRVMAWRAGLRFGASLIEPEASS